MIARGERRRRDACARHVDDEGAAVGGAPLQGNQLVHALDARGRRPLEQDAERLGGDARVGEGAVAPGRRDPEVRRQVVEPGGAAARAAGGARGGDRADRRQRERAARQPFVGRAEVRHVEGRVVRGEHGAVAGKGGGSAAAPRGSAAPRRPWRSVMPGQPDHEQLHRPARMHERLELVQQAPAAHAHRADLGDRALARRAARGLDVDDDEV